ncbi:MAG TPA: hypothetical protein VH397_21425, partial [Xanthobacteraceae bacterium]
MPDTPALVKRSTSRTWRIAVLSAGIRSPSAKAQGDPKRAGRGAVPNALYPGDIIPERQAKSSRNAERHHLGLAGDIIPDSRATSPGISMAPTEMYLTCWMDRFITEQSAAGRGAHAVAAWDFYCTYDDEDLRDQRLPRLPDDQQTRRKFVDLWQYHTISKSTCLVLRELSEPAQAIWWSIELNIPNDLAEAAFNRLFPDCTKAEKLDALREAGAAMRRQADRMRANLDELKA